MPTVTPQEHLTYQEWLYLEPDGELTRTELAKLERHLEDCASCRTERLDVAAMNHWMASAKAEADPTLAQRVMENLPPAGWDARSPRAWRPAAAVVALLVLAAVVTAMVGTGTGAVAPAAGAARAVIDLLLTTALAGAGLLGASWQGLGLALGEVFGGSKVTLVVFGVFVVGLDFLVLRHLLRQPRRALATRRDR